MLPRASQRTRPSKTCLEMVWGKGQRPRAVIHGFLVILHLEMDLCAVRQGLDQVCLDLGGGRGGGGAFPFQELDGLAIGEESAFELFFGKFLVAGLAHARGKVG